MSETFKFEAEINQLMNLIINAFYSNKDVFLRELVSNSSDALDKIRYLSMTQNNTVLDAESKLEIRIIPNKDDNTLTIWDTGIGMTRNDLVQNLGTVARSGTKAFLENLKESGDMNLIGQFGVGFYSAYLVADRVEVFSKHNDDHCYKWESDANNTFTIGLVTEPDQLVTRGTKIVIHLKQSESQYLEETKIRDIVKKHSNYVNYPIMLWTTKNVQPNQSKDEDPANDDDDKCDHDDDCKCDDVDEEKEVDDEKPIVEDADEQKEVADEQKEVDDDKPKIETTVDKTKDMAKKCEYDRINSSTSIWTRNPKEITAEEYGQFYKEFSGDWQDYAYVKHFNVEGKTEFTALLYVPARAPFNMFHKEHEVKTSEIKLYVRKVFITDKCEDMVPEYLNFVKGVVNSQDLPLNVSREMLQQTDIMLTMKNYIVKQVIDILVESAESTDSEEIKKYDNFYQNFSKNIKLGVYQDDKNRDRMMKLLRYYSSMGKNGDKDSQISLTTYVDNMVVGQNAIYYISGESIKSIEDSPFVKYLKNKKYDVLFLTDPIDEYMMQRVKEFNGKKIVNVSSENADIDVDAEEKEKQAKLESELSELCTFMKSTLADSVEKVIVSKRIVDVPCVVSSGQFGWSANMERIMKAQALGNNDMMDYMAAKKTLEINPQSAMIKKISEKFTTNKNDPVVKNLVWLLYETSMISAGFALTKPSHYANRIYNIVGMGLDVDSSLEDDDKVEDDQSTCVEEPVVESDMEKID